MVKNKTNKNYKRSQKGRSMVEMLGVLAIIGVLSVGGLYGYGVAMKKHKANQLLHEASMHAATVSAQIMSGKDPTDLTDFGTGNTITLDKASMAGNTTFKLKMAGIGKDVCEQMKNVKGGIVRDVTCDEAAGDATITYYKNLATTEAEGEKSPTGELEVSIDTGVCENGNVYLSYNEGTECDTATPQDMECTKNSDCTGEKCSAESGKCYCHLDGDWLNNCSEITGGTCETLDAGTPITYTHTYTSGGESETKELLLGGYMNWWAAENWCKAHQMSLVKVSTLGCTASGTSGSCPTSVYSDMNAAGLGKYYWTADSYNSCRARLVNVYLASFGNGRRDYDDICYALCEKYPAF